MNYTDAVALVWRRRWLTLLCLVATAVGAVAAGYRLVDNGLASRFRPVYESVAVVSLVPTGAPPAAGPSGDQQPAVESDSLDAGRLQGVTKSLQVVLTSPGFADRLHHAEPASRGASLDAEAADSTNVLRLTATGPTPTSALGAINGSVAQLKPTLDRYAASAAVRFSLQANLVDGPSSPAATSSMKAPVVSSIAAIAGLVLSWSLLVIVDGVRAASTRKRRSRRERPPVDVVDVAASPVAGKAETLIGVQD